MSSLPPPRAAHVALADALARLPDDSPRRSVELFRHGTLLVKLYAPQGVDPQTPHGQDEAYVVARGRAVFWDGAARRPVAPGTFLFAAAGHPHRFEELSDDFAAWVIYYGPEGGEGPHA